MKINTLIKKLYRIFLEIVIAILIGVVLLIIEYKTGYFADKYAGQKSVWVFIFILSQVILFFSTEFMFITWIQAKINTRERFSLSIALFSFSLTMALLASFFVQLFPWHLFIVLSEFV